MMPLVWQMRSKINNPKYISIDEYVFGISAVEQKGHESLISAYVMPERTNRTYETKDNQP